MSEDFEWDGNAAFVSCGHTLKINGTIQGCQKKTASDKYLIEVKDDPNKESNVVTSVGLTKAALITNGVANAVKVVDTKFSVETSNITTSDNGFAVNVKADTKAVHVNLGTQQGATIIGNVAFENNYSGSRLTVSAGSKIQGKLVTSGSNLKGLYVSVDSNAEVDTTKGWPNPLPAIEGTEVGDLESLKKALDDEKVTNIVLTKPITLNEGTLDIKGKTITLSSTFFRDNKDNAAFIVQSQDQTVIIQGEKGVAKIVGSSENKDKYLIKALSTVQLSGIALEATGALNGIYVQNTLLNTKNRTSITSKAYALDLIAEEANVQAMIKDGSVISGGVHCMLNFHTDKQPNVIKVNNGKITGALEVYGSSAGELTVVLENNGTVGGGSSWEKYIVNEGGENPGEGGNKPQGGNTQGQNFWFNNDL